MKTDPVSEVSLSQIVEARSRLNGAIVRTPCTESAALSELTGARIFCKQEHLAADRKFQGTGSAQCLGPIDAGASATWGRLRPPQEIMRWVWLGTGARSESR